MPKQVSAKPAQKPSPTIAVANELVDAGSERGGLNQLDPFGSLGLDVEVWSLTPMSLAISCNRSRSARRTSNSTDFPAFFRQLFGQVLNLLIERGPLLSEHAQLNLIDFRRRLKLEIGSVLLLARHLLDLLIPIVGNLLLNARRFASAAGRLLSTCRPSWPTVACSGCIALASTLVENGHVGISL